MTGYRYRENAVKRETLLSKINNQPGGSEPLDNTHSSMKQMDSLLSVNGRGRLSVGVVVNQFLDVLLEGRTLVTTVPTSLLVTTKRGTFIVSVIDATTAGTLRTTKNMTGQIRALKAMHQEVKLPPNGNKPFTTK